MSADFEPVCDAEAESENWARCQGCGDLHDGPECRNTSCRYYDAPKAEDDCEVEGA